MGSCQHKNSGSYQEQATFYHQVVSQLCHPKPQSECPLKLAFYFANIVQEFTGDEIVRGCQSFSWPKNMGVSHSTTVATRRTRVLDRAVKYCELNKFSMEDTYNCLFLICPHVETIVRMNKGQSWEANNDWFIYDVYAQLALLCVPGQAPEGLRERAGALVREIEREYEPEEAEKIKGFCKYLEQRMQRTPLFWRAQTFGHWTVQCLEHFCQIALNGEKADRERLETLRCTTHLVLHFCLMHPKLWFNKPCELVAAAVSSASTFLGSGSWGNWFVVQFRTAVRGGILLDSDTVAILNPGDVVHVVEKFGRRVQVDSPARGFCSLHDGAGLRILTQIKTDNLLTTLTGMTHDGMQSPFRDMTRWIFTDRTSTYASLKQKFRKAELGGVASLEFSNGKLVQADALMEE